MYGPATENSFSLTFWNYKNVSDEFVVINSRYIKKKAIQYNETTVTKGLANRSLSIVFNVFVIFLLINVTSKLLKID